MCKCRSFIVGDWRYASCMVYICNACMLRHEIHSCAIHQCKCTHMIHREWYAHISRDTSYIRSTHVQLILCFFALVYKCIHSREYTFTCECVSSRSYANVYTRHIYVRALSAWARIFALAYKCTYSHVCIYMWVRIFALVYKCKHTHI